MAENVLEIENLSVDFVSDKQRFHAVNDVSLSVKEGEILGIVGESGSGKSTLCLSVLKLFEGTSAQITQGSIRMRGAGDILCASRKELSRIRGGIAGMVFQEPMSSLNPVMTVGNMIENSLKIHSPELNKKERKERVIALLKSVNIPSPQERAGEYPHQLSGGMRQRVMIALAMANRPKLLLCDEPTTALDVTVQAQVLSLVREIAKKDGSGVLFVTHAMGVIAQIADRVAVMYCGRVVEEAPVKELFENPAHPYTKGLLLSIPRIECEAEELPSIPGYVSREDHNLEGCAFARRCPYASEACMLSRPALRAVNGNPEHKAACFLQEESTK